MHSRMYVLENLTPENILQHTPTQVRKIAAKSPRSRRQEDDDEFMNNEGTNLFAKLLEEKLKVSSEIS